ncbi:transposase [bacterium AH-315-J21]|nr:transposase [bacterium AH-315-J21]
MNTARFITFCCYHRFELLKSSRVIEVFLEELESLRLKYDIRILGYVIMPEHVHLVLFPPENSKLGPIIGELKSKSASRILTEQLIELPESCIVFKNGQRRRIFWQPRCYDHNCRTVESVVEKVNYCHNNPMKRGLTNEPNQWRWSSYNSIAGEKDIALRIDRIDETVQTNN